MPDLDSVTAVIPALDEEHTIGDVVAALRRAGIGHVLVADNGSRDATAARARAAGAEVVHAHRRGYGAACAAGLEALPSRTRVVLFCDGDGADELDAIERVVGPVLRGEADLVVGSRVLGGAEPGALTPPQRFGNALAAALLRALFGAEVTDLGPFRCISVRALDALGMTDRSYGWTVEMQALALRAGLSVLEVPVRARVRRGGVSKISGRVGPVFAAGWCILTTIARVRLRTAEPAVVKQGR